MLLGMVSLKEPLNGKTEFQGRQIYQGVRGTEEVLLETNPPVDI